MVGRDQAKLDTMRQQLPDGGASASTLMADVTDSKQVENAINTVAELHGRIDSVANCVGSIVLKSAHTTTDAEFDQAGRMTS
jgi:NADP-dependent 3-hydroxy acid dehydrogenase YdfG